MAISRNTGVSNSANTSATCTLAIPGGVLAGDVMVMALEVFTEVSTAPTISFSGAGGSWTLGATAVFSTDNTVWAYLYPYYRVATAGDIGATLTVTETGSGSGTTWFAIAMEAYTGANTAGPFDVIPAGTETQGSLTVTTPTASTVVANDWAVYICGGGYNSSATTISPPAGSVTQQNVNSSAGVGATLADSNGIVGPAGTSIGGGNFTLSGGSLPGSYLVSFTIGLAPSIPGGPPGMGPSATPVKPPYIQVIRAGSAGSAHSI